MKRQDTKALSVILSGAKSPRILVLYFCPSLSDKMELQTTHMHTLSHSKADLINGNLLRVEGKSCAALTVRSGTASSRIFWPVQCSHGPRQFRIESTKVPPRDHSPQTSFRRDFTYSFFPLIYGNNNQFRLCARHVPQSYMINFFLRKLNNYSLVILQCNSIFIS